METLGEKIKKARKNKGFTQKELAALVKSSNTAVSNWEKDLNKPDVDTLELLCWALDVSPKYFLDTKISDRLSVFDIPGVLPLPKMKKIPLLGTIACGEPILAEENIEEYIDVVDGVKATFALRCKGDSMINARIMDGDIVLIREQPEVEDGEIAAVMIDGMESEATLKRVRHQGDALVLWPENNNYQPRIFTDESLLSVHILGKAVAFLSAVR
jgi:repressor LexA